MLLDDHIFAENKKTIILCEDDKIALDVEKVLSDIEKLVGNSLHRFDPEAKYSTKIIIENLSTTQIYNGL